MKIWGLVPKEIEHAAKTVELDIRDIKRVGYAYHVKLALRPEKDEYGNKKYQRLSASWHNDTRRVNAVCWHGYRDFMKACYAISPDVRIKTTMADYKNYADFMEKYRDTYYTNVGSQMFPREYGECCTC